MQLSGTACQKKENRSCCKRKRQNGSFATTCHRKRRLQLSSFFYATATASCDFLLPFLPFFPVVELVETLPSFLFIP